MLQQFQEKQQKNLNNKTHAFSFISTEKYRIAITEMFYFSGKILKAFTNVFFWHAWQTVWKRIKVVRPVSFRIFRLTELQMWSSNRCRIQGQSWCALINYAFKISWRVPDDTQLWFSVGLVLRGAWKHFSIQYSQNVQFSATFPVKWGKKPDHVFFNYACHPRIHLWSRWLRKLFSMSPEAAWYP